MEYVNSIAKDIYGLNYHKIRPQKLQNAYSEFHNSINRLQQSQALNIIEPVISSFEVQPVEEVKKEEPNIWDQKKLYLGQTLDIINKKLKSNITAKQVGFNNNKQIYTILEKPEVPGRDAINDKIKAKVLYYIIKYEKPILTDPQKKRIYDFINKIDQIDLIKNEVDQAMIEK